MPFSERVASYSSTFIFLNYIIAGKERRHQSEERESGADDEAESADGEDDGPAGAATDGRHGRLAEHDGSAAKSRRW